MTDAQVNRRILLAWRPQGAPVPEDFRIEDGPMPEPRNGEALVRTIWLSLDPYMRGRMNDAPSYAPPVALGDVMEGESVGRVEASRAQGLAPGDYVRGRGGWQSWFALPADKLALLDPKEAPLSTALGVLGTPGLTAYAGLQTIARPVAGETVVVGAASGAVGAITGQLARLEGCRVVGVAGGAEKCRHVIDELGFDLCLDRYRPDLAGRLREACPNGIDVYVELVGGELFWAVLPLLNLHARIPVIGSIAWYNLERPPEGSDRTPQLMRAVLTRRLRIEGLLVPDHADLAPEFRRTVAPLVQSGRLRFREDVVVGLDEAPAALIGMLE